MQVAVLAAVAHHGMKYGYEIQQWLLSIRGQQRIGGVYTILHRLEKEGLVTASWGEGNQARQRQYTATAQGKEICERLRAELLRLCK